MLYIPIIRPITHTCLTFPTCCFASAYTEVSRNLVAVGERLRNSTERRVQRKVAAAALAVRGQRYRTAATYARLCLCLCVSCGSSDDGGT